MSENDEPEAKTHGRRKKRRRSLRVPVDEVPRPTSTAELADEPHDGGATVEMPAFDPEQGRVTLEDASPPSADEEPLDDEALEPIEALDETAEEDPPADEDPDLELDEPLVGAAEEPLAAEPTVVRAPDERPVAGEADPARALVDADAPSVEVDLDEPDAQPEEAEEPEDREEPEERTSTTSEPPPAVVGVVVQRVVAVVSAPPSSPPPPIAEESAADTQPGTELAVDVDEEPELRIAEPDAGELDELDVDLDEAEAAQASSAPARRDSAPEIPTEEAEELLEEAEEELAAAAALDEKKRPSKPPPPPAKSKDAAPPPPPEAPPAEPVTSAPARRKKARRQWWEELFNDDYLRTVPIPHPRVIQRQCDFIEQRFGLAQGATILDVGCGLGLHAVELTRRGYLVVGLDLSLPMLSRAADEAQDHGFKINFLHADMREMNFDGAFDAVLCYGTTFGYFDDETNKQVVERLYRALKPRGLLLLDVVNRDFVIRNQPNLVWFEGDGCVVMEESQMNYITSRLEVKRTVILDNGRQRDNVYSLRSYSLHELGQILHQQRFRVVEVTGWEAHPGVFFGGDSPKLIILAERRPMGPPTPPGRSTSSSGEMQAVDGEPAPSSEPAPAEDSELATNEAAPEAIEDRPEPSEAVTEALAETLERSGELDLGERDSAEELEAEEIEEALEAHELDDDERD